VRSGLDLAAALRAVTRRLYPSPFDDDEEAGVSFEVEAEARADVYRVLALDRSTMATSTMRLPASAVRELSFARDPQKAHATLVSWSRALRFQLDDRIRLELGIRGEV
jgi:hypothetical protein